MKQAGVWGGLEHKWESRAIFSAPQSMRNTKFWNVEVFRGLS